MQVTLINGLRIILIPRIEQTQEICGELAWEGN